MKNIKIGDIVMLKKECLGNPVGAVGIVYLLYDNGFQAIFENGNYDGFSMARRMPDPDKTIEADFFLRYIGHSNNLEGYSFTNVTKLSQDFGRGVFKIALEEGFRIREQVNAAGPTGKFPNGKLNHEDEGELNIVIFRDTFGGKDKIIMRFGSPVSWIGMNPDEAKQLGELLLEKAR